MSTDHTYGYDRIIGVIDIGSNSAKCLIASLSIAPTARYIVRYEDCQVSGLASGMVALGDFQEESVEATKRALLDFYRAGEVAAVSSWRVVGTAAFRYVTRSQPPGPQASELIQFVDHQFGCSLEIITGEEEARYCYLGVFSQSDRSSASTASLPDEAIVIDIGGASTEFIHADASQQIDRLSLPIGVIHLCDQYVSSDPIAAETVAEIRSAIRRHMTVVRGHFSRVFGEQGPCCIVYGASGTMTTTATLLSGSDYYRAADIHGYPIRQHTIECLLHQVLPLTLAEREDLVGMLPVARAKAMHVGLLFLSEMMSCLNISEISVSHFGLRYGILAEIIATERNCKKNTGWIAP